MTYLIDTDIIIYSLKNHNQVVQNFRNFTDAPKAISVITYGELVYGARKSSNIEKNLAKVYRLAELFPIVDISPAIMEIFGELKASLEKSGKTIDDMDLLIAATAITNNLVLVTNNDKNFARVKGLEIVNWTRESP